MAGKPKTKKYKAEQAARQAEGKARGLTRAAPRLKPKTEAQKAASPEDLIYGHPPESWATFLKVFIETARQDRACEASGIPRQSVYNRRKGDPGFEEAWVEARTISMQLLEDEAIRRAVEGVDKPNYYKGDIVGWTTEYSDHLLTFMLMNNDKKYARKPEGEGGPGAALPPTINLTVTRKG